MQKRENKNIPSTSYCEILIQFNANKDVNLKCYFKGNIAVAKNFLVLR